MMKQIKSISALAIVALFAASCTGERPAKFPEGELENIFSKATFTDAEMVVKTSESSMLKRMFGGSNRYLVQEAAGNDALKPMFNHLEIEGKSSGDHTIRFELDRKNVTAYKVVSSLEELSDMEVGLATQTADGRVQVPVFQYKIANFGVPTRIKNDLGEETDKLKLQETEWENATHIVVSTLSKNRADVELTDEQRRTTFSKNVFETAEVLITTASRSFFSRGDVDGGVEVSGYQGPEALKSMFDDLKISGNPSESYNVRFLVDKDFVTAVKVVPRNVEGLSLLESSLIEEMPGDPTSSIIPIFQFKIGKYGTLERSREDGIAGNKINLEPAAFTSAKYLNVDPHSANRLEYILSDEQRRTTFSRKLLESAEVTLTTAAKTVFNRGTADEKAEISSYIGPEALRSMFEDMKISGKPDHSYNVRFQVDRDFVTAVKVVPRNVEGLSVLESSLIEEMPGNKHLSIIPMFQFKIGKYGNFERARENGIAGNKIALQPSAFAAAKFISLDPHSANRLEYRFPEGTEKSLFTKTFLNEAQVSVTTKGSVLAEKDELRAGGATQVEVDNAGVKAPELLKVMFSDLVIRGNPSKTYPFRLSVERGFVVANKVLSDTAIHELSPEEKLFMKRDSQKRILVPTFKYAIAAYGKIGRKKNEKGQQTTELELEPTDFDSATHVMIKADDLASREVVGASTIEASREVYLPDAIDGATFRKSDLRTKLGIPLQGSDGTLYQVRLSGSQLDLFEILSEKDLTASELSKLRSGKKSDGITEVSRCDAKAKAMLEEKARDKCVVVLRYNVPVQHVAAGIKKDKSGNDTAEIEYKVVPRGKDTFVKIPENVLPVEKNVVEIDPKRMLVVSEMKATEFLLRRTMQDSPNSFDYTFPGSAGNLEIVRFSFEEKGVRIVRADALTKVKASSEVDQETLMFIPAAYFRREMTDASGNPLSSPRYVNTDSSDRSANLIAYVDWSNNRMPNVASALDYYSLETCFMGTGVKSISDVDHSMDRGVLSFTMSTTYAANPGQDCVGLYQAGYFDTVQANFSFDERISFKRYEKGQDETPLLDLPYNAQKRLGFGLFTHKKNAPNANGNTGTDGTEIPLPAIFDIRSGKTINYVLAGLPEEEAVRNAVIKATEDVVRDWNNAFRMALSGTPMQRTDDVVRLHVPKPGEDIGKLGDLDKNFIYYVEKKTGSGVIGLGGNSPNPRSGKVEAGSVFMYGGNIFSYVERLKQMEAARAAYHAKVDQLTPLPPKEGAKPADVKPPGGGDLAGIAGLIAEIDPSMNGKVIHMNADRRTLKESLKRGAEASKGTALQSMSNESALALRRSLRPDQAAVFEALKSAVETGAIRDPRKLELLILENQIKHAGSAMNRDQLARLRNQLSRKQAVHHLMEKMAGANICVHEAPETALQDVKDLASKSDIELAMSVYKPTLAHEIGHNLGLRHNFISSYDKANWTHAGEESKRDYSSVMDYLANDHGTYDGLGPQDVAAIRTAYAGMLELDPAVVKDLADGGLASLPLADGKKAQILGGKFISTSDYLKVLGLKSWLDFSMPQIARLPVKRYAFCSDEDVLYTPVCNRFDSGTTPAEVVQAVRENYKSMYSIRNFPGDKLQFGYWDYGSYIGRLFGMLTPARQMLEETFYQAISGAGSETINAYVEGAVEALFLLHEIARNPDAPMGAMGDERFVDYETEKGIVKIERKHQQSLQVDGMADRLSVRGIEFDKVISMILLTERRMGFPRYEQASIRLSFPQFENMIKLSLDPKSPDGGLTLNLIKSTLMDNVIPFGHHPAVGIIPLTDGRFKSSSTEMMRLYATLGGLVNLDIDGFEVSNNLSALFRVMSGKQAPQGVKAVLQGGLKSDAQGELRYWAYDQAVSAKGMIGLVSVMDDLIAVKPELTKDVQAWLAKKIEILGAAEAKPEDLAKLNEELAVIVKKIDTMLALLPESVGPREMAKIEPLLMQVLQIAIQLQNAGDDVTPLDIDGLATELENLAKARPIFAVMMEALPAEQLKIPMLGRIVPSGLLENQRGTTFRNAQTLNQIFLAVHPEFNR